MIGQFNTGVGAGTLALNTGDSNTATGAGALLFNTTGGANTANGVFALLFNTTGNNNTASGDTAQVRFSQAMVTSTQRSAAGPSEQIPVALATVPWVGTH